MFSGIGTINLDDNDDIRTVTLQTSGVATNTNVTLGAIDGDPGAAGTDQNLTVAATSAVDLQGTITNVDTLDVSADTDNNESLLLAGTPGISVGGSITTTAGPVTLGGAVVQSNDDVDIDASVSAFTDLTIRNAGVSDLDGNANLTANGGNLVATNVVSLNLSGGSPTTNTLTAQGAGGSNIDLTNTLVTASSPDTVTFTSENGITLNTVSVGTNTTVVIDLDTNAGGATLTVDDITAGALDVDGTGVDDDMNFNGFINTTGFTGAANGSVAIDNAATVDFQGAAATDDVTAGLSVVIGNTTTLMLADNIDITASAGDLDLSGVGTLTIPADGTNVLSADGDASTITVPDTTGTGASLTVTSEGDINFTGGGLDIGATAALSATVDDNASGGVETLTVGQTLDAGSIALSGTGTNDTIDINSNLTADATDVTVQNAATVEIDTGLTVLAATNVDVSTGVTSIDLTDDPGVAVDVTFTGTGGTVSLANIDDNAASTVDNLNVNAGTTATLGSVTLDDAGTGNATVDANTSTVLNGAINIDGLLTVGVGDDGTAALNNAVINADGGAVFSGLVDGNAVSLGAGVTITTVDTLIHFVGSNINNGQTLSLQAGGGGVSLVELANVGNATPLTSLNVDAVDVELGGSIAATGLIDIDETGADGISTAGSITSSGDDVQINTGGPFGFADDNISGVEVAITAALEITNNLGIITASAATATAMALSGQEIGSFIGSPIEIALTGDGELTLTTPTQTGANTGDIFITSDSNNILLGVITVDANAADLDVDIRTTTTGNISLANASTATVDVDLVLNAAGTLTVANLGGGAELTFGTYDIDAAGVNIAGEIVSLSNTVDIDSTTTVSVAGTITSNGAVTIDTVGVTSDVDISVTGTVETAAGNDDLSVRSVTIGGGTGVGRNVIISGTVQTGNATSSAPLADVTSGGITIANVSGTVSGGGTLTTGSADESGNANVTALSGSVSITTTGPVATIQNDKFNCAYERWCYVLSLLCVH